MYQIECNNCRETSQIHDRMKGRFVRCHICKEVIQFSVVENEVLRNMNKIENHEKRILELENPEPVYSQPVYSQPSPPSQDSPTKTPDNCRQSCGDDAFYRDCCNRAIACKQASEAATAVYTFFGILCFIGVTAFFVYLIMQC